MVTLKNQFLDRICEQKESDSLAFCIAGDQYTYRQLFDYVDQIYDVVRDVPEDLVFLYATDDIRTYAGFALWMLGKAYVPLNPNQPCERHREIISSVRAHTILSSDDYVSPIGGVSVIYTGAFTHLNCERKCELKLADVPEDRLAYILFTSGSTGKPKGVQLTRGNVAYYIDSVNKIGLDFTFEDRCLQPFDLTFDFSVASYVLPLLHGASIFTIPNKAVKFTYIASLLEDYHLTLLQMVPSMIRNLLPYQDEVDLSSVRYNIICGEALTGKVIREWHKANPNMVSYNMYGPTENTVFCTYYRIDKGNIDKLITSNDIVSIGKSFENSEADLLNMGGSVINAAGVEGELCLAGNQLTPGYWENEEENAEKFFMLNGKRYYRSGDLCYYGASGNLMFIGRKDFQVKINGYRVEIGGIESGYSKISNGRFCVVIPYTDSKENIELAIVIEGEEYDYSSHRTALSRILPSYEVPNRWLFMKQIPLNVNGKVDRKAIINHFKL